MKTDAPRKLPGSGLNWTGRGKLWQGQDHLLEVTTLFIMQHYRRFFFHETKAFSVQRTKVRLGWALGQGGVGAICALVAGSLWWIGERNPDEDWHVLLYVFAGMIGAAALFCLALLAVNLLLGPSCRCHILTPTGWHVLAAPARLGPALRVQAQIIPLIEAAQLTLAHSDTP
jgi:hypothetical protein